MPGRLVERPVDVGTEVVAGQVVARLADRDFKNALDRAVAAQAQSWALREPQARWDIGYDSESELARLP